MQGNKWYLHGKVHYKLCNPPNYQFEQIILLLSYSTILQIIGLIFKTKDRAKPATPWTALAPTGSSILSQTETELPWIWILTAQIVALLEFYVQREVLYLFMNEKLSYDLHSKQCQQWSNTTSDYCFQVRHIGASCHDTDYSSQNTIASKHYFCLSLSCHHTINKKNY